MNSCALAFLLPALHSTTEQYCHAFLVPKCWWHTMVASLFLTPFSNQHFYSSAIQQQAEHGACALLRVCGLSLP